MITINLEEIKKQLEVTLNMVRAIPKWECEKFGVIVDAIEKYRREKLYLLLQSGEETFVEDFIKSHLWWDGFKQATRSYNENPIVRLAILKGGFEDVSYNTVRYGWVFNYRGEAVVEYNNRKYRVSGKGTTGTPETLYTQGGYTIQEIV